MPASGEPIDLLFACDVRGAEAVAVSAYSALRASSRPTRVWMVEDGFDARLKRQMQATFESVPAYAGGRFIALGALPLAMPFWWSRAKWPLVACARFQVAEVLPAECRRCIYLDYDVCVGTDLSALFDMDLAGAPLGMVQNALADEKTRTYLRELGLDPARYGNSGVLLIDLDAWRQEGVAADLIRFSRTLPRDLWFPDQDMINLYFKDRWHPLDRRWNSADAGLPADGRVLHFTGPVKPWTVTGPDAALPGYQSWQAVRREIRLDLPRPSPWRRLARIGCLAAGKLYRQVARGR